MAVEEPDQRGITRTNSGRVIVFDPVKGTLTTEKAKNLDSKLHIFRDFRDSY
jgi:hypothetical protein